MAENLWWSVPKKSWAGGESATFFQKCFKYERYEFSASPIADRYQPFRAQNKDVKFKPKGRDITATVVSSSSVNAHLNDFVSIVAEKKQQYRQNRVLYISQIHGF